MNLKKIYNDIRKHKFSNEEFVSVEELYDLLRTTPDIELVPGIITPFYISNDKIYEIYWYELTL